MMMKNKVIWLALLVILVASLAACHTASNQPLPKSMKGYELYSWQQNGKWRFTLVTGTDRDKTLDEIISGEEQVTGGGWVGTCTLQAWTA